MTGAPTSAGATVTRGSPFAAAGPGGGGGSGRLELGGLTSLPGMYQVCNKFHLAGVCKQYPVGPHIGLRACCRSATLRSAKLDVPVKVMKASCLSNAPPNT